MILLAHILIALSSFAYTTYLLVRPSHAKFRVNYALIALTLGSGAYLVVSTGAPMLQACVSGLAYVLIVAAGTVLAHVRLNKRAS